MCVRDTWDPFQLNPIGAEKEEKRRCFQIAQYLMAAVLGLTILISAVVAKVELLILSAISQSTDFNNEDGQHISIASIC